MDEIAWPVRLFWWARLRLKETFKRFCLVEMYCKRCGRGCRNFRVDDLEWHDITARYWGELDTEDGVLCYDCFATIAQEQGFRANWMLIQHEAAHPPDWWRGYPRRTERE